MAGQSSLLDLMQLDNSTQKSVENLETSTESSDSDSRRKSWLSSRFQLKQTEDGRMRRFCSHTNCRKDYSKSTSHKTLKRHYRKKHDEIGSSSGPEMMIFSEKKHLEYYIRHIVMDERPYSSAESSHFRKFWSEMDVNKTCVSRQFVSDAVIVGSSKLREMIKARLSEAKSMALTFDLWSSRSSGKSFACVTGHYIDDDWNLKSIIIEFDSVPYPHTGNNIREFLLNSISEMDVIEKVISITTDNAKNNDVAFENIKLTDTGALIGFRCPFKFTHYHCVAHIFNLGVQDALDELDELLTPSREIVHAIRCTNKRQEQFKSIQIDLDSLCKPLMLIGEIETRWNSTYAMLKRLLKLQEPVIWALQTMDELSELSEPDWQLLRNVVEFLEPFDEFTLMVSGETYSSIGIVNLLVPLIIQHCNVDYQDLKINRAACAFKLKLNEYKHHFDNETPMLATILDPRVKLTRTSEDQTVALTDILRGFLPSDGHQVSVLSSLKKRLLSSSIHGSHDEVSKYLSCPVEDIDSDPIEFWSANKKNYPNLAEVAKMLLPIQATSVPSERTFSRASLIDTAHRSSLSPESLRAGILARNYLKFLDLE